MLLILFRLIVVVVVVVVVVVDFRSKESIPGSATSSSPSVSLKKKITIERKYFLNLGKRNLQNNSFLKYVFIILLTNSSSSRHMYRLLDSPFQEMTEVANDEARRVDHGY